MSRSGPGDTSSIISTSSGTRSIYPRGPTFSLDTFSSKDFLVKDFVEALSEGAASSKRRSAGGAAQSFDPKPYIRTFEHALSRLSILSEERESHEQDLASAARRTEAQHKNHCATLQSRLDEALESFNSLEHRPDVGLNGSAQASLGRENDGSVALQIGDRLEELDRQKRRAEDAKFLLQCWQDLIERGDLSLLEDVRRLGGGEGKVKCAQAARQLLKICSRLSSESPEVNGNGLTNGNGHRQGNGPSTQRMDEAKEAIEKFLERLEKDLLEQFDNYKRQHNDVGMRECAIALHDFSEGASVVARFVNQHEFFLDRNHMISEEVTRDQGLWDRLADPDADPPGVESSLQSLVDEAKLVLQEESFTIKQVFPFYESVMITFLQRIFQQSIQQRLEMLLEQAKAVSPLAFLRTLQAARGYIVAMVEELKRHGLTEHPETTSAQVTATLDQQSEDLFIPYVSGTSYIDQERRNLEDLYTSLLFKFTLYHSRRRKVPTTVIGTLSQRGKELLSSARDRYMARLEASDLSGSQKRVLLRIGGVRDTNSTSQQDIEVNDEDGALSLPIAKRMLKWLAEASGRSLELSGGSETPKDVSTLLRVLLTTTGDIYLDTALDAANENAAVQETVKSEPDMAFIPDMKASVSILRLTTTISDFVLIPLAAANVTVKRDMEKSVQALVVRMEDKIGLLRSRTADVAIGWVTKLLARQNRSDFRPRDDEIAIDQLQTATCSSIFAFLTRVRALMLRTLDGKNSEVFFTDLAIGIRQLLLEHFKKFQVNLAGGLMVSKDITKYIELLRTLPLASSFMPSLEVLVEVGNLFVINPEALKDRLRGGGALTGIERGDLRPYILRRDDAGSIGVQSVLNAL